MLSDPDLTNSSMVTNLRNLSKKVARAQEIVFFGLGLNKAGAKTRRMARRCVYAIVNDAGVRVQGPGLPLPPAVSRPTGRDWIDQSSAVGGVYALALVAFNFGQMLRLLCRSAALGLRSLNPVLASATLLLATALQPAHAEPLTMNEFGTLALRCGSTVAPSTLASIAQAESRFQPLTINDNTSATAGVPATLEVAVQIATRLLEAGHSVDLGLMQINSANFAKLGLTPAQALDPCRSIAAAASILTDDYAGGDTHEMQQNALRDAISRYNTGDAKSGFENGYVHRVELAARQIVPSLDVDTPSAATGGAHPTLPVSSEIEAPPSWNVWAASDDAARRPGIQATTMPVSESGTAVLADAAPEPTVSANLPARATEGSP